MSLLNSKVQSTYQARAGAYRRFGDLGACFRARAEGEQGLIPLSAEICNRGRQHDVG